MTPIHPAAAEWYAKQDEDMYDAAIDIANGQRPNIVERPKDEE